LDDAMSAVVEVRVERRFRHPPERSEPHDGDDVMSETWLDQSVAQWTFDGRGAPERPKPRREGEATVARRTDRGGASRSRAMAARADA
jgi:hypothetical protein